MRYYLKVTMASGTVHESKDSELSEVELSEMQSFIKQVFDWESGNMKVEREHGPDAFLNVRFIESIEIKVRTPF